ncbi:MAG: hypothetical protein PHO56_04415 [Patescibacteria group bacterium]|nr:hypothetical protein [Patescibacteria group bacterium]
MTTREYSAYHSQVDYEVAMQRFSNFLVFFVICVAMPYIAGTAILWVWGDAKLLAGWLAPIAAALDFLSRVFI